jgi:hypothetical protein
VIVDGRYWVLNVPWSSSKASVSIRCGNDGIHVESEDIVCRVCDGRVAEMESVHGVSPSVRFLRMDLPDLSTDFSLAKRRFVERLRGENAAGHEEVIYLEKPNLMCFVSPLLLYYFRETIHSLIVDFPDQVISYIVNQPMKIKQTTVIKQSLGGVARLVCIWQKAVLDTQHPLIFVNKVFLFPVYCWLHAFTAMYFPLLVAFKEALHLLKNSSYNPLKKRNDCANLTTDQIFLTVLLFSFFLFLIINMVCFYALFTSIRLFLAILKLIESFVDFMLVDTSKCQVHALELGKSHEPAVQVMSRRVGICDKMWFALEAAFCECEISDKRFFIKILTGMK